VLAACSGAAPTAAPPKPPEPPKAGGAATAAAPANKPVTAAQASVVARTAAPPGDKQPTTVRLHMRSGGEKSEPAIDVDRPGEWQQETGHKVKLEPTPGGEDYVPKILALAAGGTIGDALFTGDTMSEHTHLVRNKVIEPVDGYLDGAGVKKTEWLKPIVDQLTHDGKMHGLPKTGHPGEPFIWVNLTMFDKAGIKRPAVKGATFDDVRTWARAFTKGPEDKRDVYGYYTSVKGAQGWTSGIRRRGGDVLAADGRASLADTAAWLEWADWNVKLITQDKVHPLGLQNLGTDLPSMVAAGRLAMFHGARYLHFPTRVQVKDAFEWTVIQYPSAPKPRGWLTAVDTHSGAAASTQKDAGFSLIKAMSDRRFAYLVGKTQGYLTGRADNLEALKEVGEDPFLWLQYECGAEQERMWRAANLRAYEIEAEIDNRTDELWLGKKPPDKLFMEVLKKSLDAILAKPDP
jgi:hypothetical protein